MLLKHISFRKKIFIIIFSSILLPLIIVSIILYIKAKNAITTQTQKTVAGSMSYVISNIDSSLKAINQMSNSILSDARTLSIIKIDKSTPHAVKIRKYTELCDILNSYSNRIQNTFMLSGIDSYYLYINGQHTIIDSNSTYYENIKEADGNFLNKEYIKPGFDSWFLTQPFEETITGFTRSRLSEDKLITYDKLLTNKNGSIAAVLAINVASNFISDNLNKIQTGAMGEIIATNSEGSLVTPADKIINNQSPDKYIKLNNKITKLHNNDGSFFMNIDGENVFVIYCISDYTKWRYVAILPSKQVLGQAMEMKNFVIIVIFTAIFLVLGITYLLSYIFYNPLEKLVLAMQKIENGDLSVTIDDNRDDEYHRVYKGFNNMVGELNTLIKDLVNEKLLNKEGQIKLLQAQINPHFLYNTLESINSIAKIKKVNEISSIVTALSKFFRISISGGKDVVPLKAAMDLAVNYLTIQNIRFSGKINHSIKVPDELYDLIVPKLILQPIVENAIYHGIEKLKGIGTLIISAKLIDNFLLLDVEDNGIGIPEDQLEELQKTIEADNYDGQNSFALRNLNRQIKLKYGPNYGVMINSTLGKGTSVNIKLPIIKEVNNNV